MLYFCHKYGTIHVLQDMPAGRTRYAIPLSMIRNDGRSINKAVGSAQAVFHRRERDSMAMLSKVR